MKAVDQIDVPFELRGHAGRARIKLSVNDDPVSLGHPLVAKDFDARRFAEFPVLEGRIEFAGTGLNAAMGWLQVIQHFDDRGVPGDLSVDRFPLGPDDSPLYTYGYAPTFFDAPANPDHPDGTWRADTWLVAIPDVLRTRRLGPLIGCRWGYRLHKGRPELLALEPLARSDWLALLPRLRRDHNRWEFLEQL